MTDHNNHEESAFCFPFNNASEELRGMFKKENTLQRKTSPISHLR